MTASKIPWAVIGPTPTRPALSTRRSTAPLEMPAAAAQASSADLAQDGIGTVRTRPWIDDRPAAFALSHIGKLQPRQLPPPQPAPHQQPQQQPIAQAFCRFRIRLVQQPLGLLKGQPVAGPDAGAAGAGDAADAGGGQGGEASVGGGFGGELAQGGEREVDRGGRQPSFEKVRAVAPQHGPCKTFSGGVGRVPGKKLFQRPVIGAAGVRAGQRVEDELHEWRRRERDQLGSRTSLPVRLSHQRVGGSWS